MEEGQGSIATAVQEFSQTNHIPPPKVCNAARIGLLDLPPEIRERIYITFVRYEHPVLLNFSTGDNDIPTQAPVGHPSFPGNLLLTCSQIYQEVRPLYFAYNSFSIYVRRRAGNEEWSYFLSPTFLDNRRQVQCLQITFFRWGTKNFFTDTLGPALEDMILNGRLRNLEIRVNRDFIAGWNDGNAMRSLNFYVLRKLLKDPYLEKAILRAGDIGDWMYWDCDSYVEKLDLEDITSKLDEWYPGETVQQEWETRLASRNGNRR